MNIWLCFNLFFKKPTFFKISFRFRIMNIKAQLNLKKGDILWSSENQISNLFISLHCQMPTAHKMGIIVLTFFHSLLSKGLYQIYANAITYYLCIWLVYLPTLALSELFMQSNEQYRSNGNFNSSLIWIQMMWFLK